MNMTLDLSYLQNSNPDLFLDLSLIASKYFFNKISTPTSEEIEKMNLGKLEQKLNDLKLPNSKMDIDFFCSQIMSYNFYQNLSK